MEASKSDIALSEHSASGVEKGSEVEKPKFTIDPKEEARLRWKIDLYIIPTVAVRISLVLKLDSVLTRIIQILYLFCFIDRANIGKHRAADPVRGRAHYLQAMPASLVSRRT